jgi:hypothetical protein
LLIARTVASAGVVCRLKRQAPVALPSSFAVLALTVIEVRWMLL